jgi:hypothetical protein
MIELMRFITREGEEFWLHAEKRPFWIVVEMCPVVSWTVRPIPPDPRTRGVIEHRFRLVHRQVKLMGVTDWFDYYEEGALVNDRFGVEVRRRAERGERFRWRDSLDKQT